jgi:hypothetical protein
MNILGIYEQELRIVHCELIAKEIITRFASLSRCKCLKYLYDKISLVKSSFKSFLNFQAFSQE